MAQYMIRVRVSPENRNESIKRFMNTDAAKAPEGLKELGRWHTAPGDGAYIAVETDDPTTITNWVLRWSDLATFEVEPVISDVELGDLFQKHGLT